jgi:HprK-related kinase A
MEWGINLVLAMRYQCFLMLHAAVLERNGRALVMPAAPGHGKTTLCAALAHRGWRLLSDEFGLLRAGTSDLLPVPRPMPLKNDAIDVLKAFEPSIVLGPVIPGTRKGTVAHLRPPSDSIARAGESAVARWIVFPRWSQSAKLSMQPVSRGEAFMRLATNAFNYEMRGETGFRAVCDLVATTSAMTLAYSDLGEVTQVLTDMADQDAG